LGIFFYVGMRNEKLPLFETLEFVILSSFQNSKFLQT
jgi:hypothetical protein